MENIRFSVIVPAYNSQKYIGKCLRSLINQTYDNYEVIVVNDGSTDNSEKVIEKYAKKCDKIKLISQKNSGPAVARKTGILSADGDYILFVDSDDWLKSEAMEHLNKAIVENDADVVQYNIIEARGVFRNKQMSFNEVVFDREEFINKYIYGICGGYGLLRRNIVKAYRRKLIAPIYEKNSVVFKIGEDAYLTLLTFLDPSFKKGMVLNDYLYFYRKGSGITAIDDYAMQYKESTRFKKALFDILVENNIKDFFLQTCLAENIGWTKYYLCHSFKDCDREKRMDIIKEVFEIPCIIQTRNYMAEHPEWDDEENKFITYDEEECCKYIESIMNTNLEHGLKYKIKRFLHRFM